MQTEMCGGGRIYRITQIRLWVLALSHPGPLKTRCYKMFFLNIVSYLCHFIYFLDVLFLRERAPAREGRWGGGRRDRGSEAGSMLIAESPIWRSNSWTMRSWPEQKLEAHPTEPPRCPYGILKANIWEVLGWLCWLSGWLLISAQFMIS